jgi:acyl-coenzyme A thioesterase PaaI-like protein
VSEVTGSSTTDTSGAATATTGSAASSGPKRGGGWATFGQHPEAHRFLEAWQNGGWQDGEALPSHQPGCYGCGDANPVGFGLTAVAAEGGGVRARYTFDDRFLGAPGLAHGGALAGLLDDVYGMVLVRELIPAVTRDLSVSYRRPIHLDEPCVLTGRLVERDGRDLHLEAAIEQHDEVKVTSTARFRVLDPERIANRYEPTDG